MILYIKKFFEATLYKSGVMTFELNVKKENIAQFNLQLRKELEFTLYREL